MVRCWGVSLLAKVGDVVKIIGLGVSAAYFGCKHKKNEVLCCSRRG